MRGPVESVTNRGDLVIEMPALGLQVTSRFEVYQGACGHQRPSMAIEYANYLRVRFLAAQGLRLYRRFFKPRGRLIRHFVLQLAEGYLTRHLFRQIWAHRAPAVASYVIATATLGAAERRGRMCV